MPTEVLIRDCPDAATIARELIAKHHAHLREEDDCSIRYLTTTAQRTQRGQEVLVTVKKAGALERFFAPLSDVAERKPDYIVLIADHAWGFLDARERRALVDHALCTIQHVADNKDGHFTLVGPDVHEFADVVRRWGLWQQNLKLFAKAMGRQAMMDLGLPGEALAGATEQEQAAHAGPAPWRTAAPATPFPDDAENDAPAAERPENGATGRRTRKAAAAPAEGGDFDPSAQADGETDPDGDGIPETVRNARSRLAGLATADHGA